MYRQKGVHPSTLKVVKRNDHIEGTLDFSTSTYTNAFKLLQTLCDLVFLVLLLRFRLWSRFNRTLSTMDT